MLFDLGFKDNSNELTIFSKSVTQTLSDIKNFSFNELWNGASRGELIPSIDAKEATRQLNEFAAQAKSAGMTSDEYLGTLGTKVPTYFRSFIASTTEAERTTQNYLQHIEKCREAQIKNGEVIEKVGLKSKLASASMTALSMAGNMLIGMAVSTGIQLLIAGLDNVINRTEKLIEAGEQARQAISDINDAYTSKKDTVSSNKDRYIELSAGVDIKTNQNLSLATEDYEEFLNITNQIAETFPSLVTGYDAQGNALLSLSGNADETTATLERLLEQERQLADFKISQNLQTAFDGTIAQIGQLQNEIDGLNEKLSSYEKIKNALDTDSKYTLSEMGIDSDDKSYAYIDMFSADTDEVARDQMLRIQESFVKAANEVGLQDIILQSLDSNAFNGTDLGMRWTADLSALTKDQLIAFTDAYKAALTESGIDIFEAYKNALLLKQQDTKEIQANWNSSVSSLITSMSVYDGYNELGDEVKQAINTGIGNIDPIKEWMDENGKIQAPSNIRAYLREKFLDPITNALDGAETEEAKEKINSAISELFSLNTSDINVVDYKKQVMNLVSQIVGDGNDKDSIIARTNFRVAYGITYIDEDGKEVWTIDDITKKISEKTGLSDTKLHNEISQEDLNYVYNMIVQGNFDFEETGNWDAFIAWIDKIKGITDEVELEPITFSSILADNSDESLTKKVDEFQSNISSIQDALDNLRSGEDIDLTDLVQQFPELAGQTDNLEAALNNLKIDKLKDFTDQWEESISGLTDKNQIKAANEFYKNLIDSIELSIDKNTVIDKINSMLWSSSIDGKSVRMRAQSVIDEFSNELETTQGREILYKILVDDGSVKLSIEQLRQYFEDEKFKIGVTVDFDSTDSLLSQINAVNSALTSQANGKSIDLATFNSDELKDYQSALEYTNGTLQLNADKVKEITKAKANEAIAYNDAQKALAQTKYIENARQIDDYREKLENLDKSSSNYADTYKTLMDNINSLSLQNDSIVDECTQWDLLSASIREATGEYQNWLNSQSAPDYGDMFSDSVNAINKVRDTLINTESDSYGNIGSVKYKAALDLMLPDTIDPKDGEAVQSYMRDTLNKYLTFDDKGNATGMDIGSFLNSAVEKGLMTVDENNDFRIAGGKSMQDFVDGMNLSLPMVQAFFDMLQLKGAEYTFAPAEDSLEGLGQKAYEASDALRQLEQFKDLEINMDVSDIDTNEGKIQALQSTIEQMQNERATLSVDSSEYEQVNSIIAYCVAQKQQLEQPVIMSVSAAPIDGELGNAISLLQEFQTATNNLEMQQSLGLDTSEAQGQIDSLVTEIQNLGNTEAGGKVLVDLGINPESQSTIEASISVMKPEVLTDLGIGIDDATPKIDEINAKQLKDKEFSVSVNDHATGILNTINNTVLNDKSFTITTNRVTVNSTKNEGGGQLLNGTAHVSGTAKVTGDWGMPSSQHVLIGELGREIVVDPHTGKWRTYGDNGAEFATIPKDAIVFNHIQSKSLLENGYVNSRATAMLRGTAFASGNAYGNGNQKVSGVFHWTGGSSNASSTSSSSSSTQSTASNTDAVNANTVATNKNTKSKAKATKTLKKLQESFSKIFDWIEVKLDRLQRDIDMAETKADNSVGYQAKNANLSNAQSITKALIQTNNKGATEYFNYAKKVQKQYDSLSNKQFSKDNKKAFDDAVKIIQNGGDLKISSYNEDVRAAIEEYQKWYDKGLECQKQAEELQGQLRELAQTKFDNIADQFDNVIGRIEHTANMLNESIDQAENKGYVGSTKFYETLVKNEKSSINQLVEERKRLTESLRDSMASGIIKKGSTEWYEMQSQIDDVTESIQEANGQLIEYANNIRQIKWDLFDRARDSVSNLVTESEFLIDLMSNDKLYTDEGKMTEEGLATFGLYGMKYDTYMKEADTYRDEMKRINAELANDPSNTKLIDRKNELLKLQQESIQAAEDEKEAIKNLVEDGINKELESLKKLIDKYNEALDSQKDLQDYQRDVADSAKEIASLQKKISAYANDTSDESKMQIQKWQNELEEKQQNLQDKEYDHFISDQKELLDDLYAEYEDILNQRLDNVDELIRQTIDSVNANANVIRDTLETQTREVGYQITSEMAKVWGNDGSVGSILTSYNEKFSNYSASVLTAIGSINEYVKALADKADKNAQTEISNDTSDTSGTAPIPSNTGTSGNTNTNNSNNTTNKVSASSTQGNGKIEVGDKITITSNDAGAWKYSSKAKSKNKLNKMLKKGASYYVGDYNSKDPFPVHLYSDKERKKSVGWVRTKWLKGYADGVKKVKDDQLAVTQENGLEIINIPKQGMLTPLTKGSTVFNNEQVQKLYEWSKDDLLHTSSQPQYISQLQYIRNKDIVPNTTNSINNSNNNNTVKIELPNVVDTQSLLNELRNNKSVRTAIQDLTIGRITGMSDLQSRYGR